MSENKSFNLGKHGDEELDLNAFDNYDVSAIEGYTYQALPVGDYEGEVIGWEREVRDIQDIPRLVFDFTIKIVNVSRTTAFEGEESDLLESEIRQGFPIYEAEKDIGKIANFVRDATHMIAPENWKGSLVENLDLVIGERFKFSTKLNKKNPEYTNIDTQSLAPA